MLSFCLGGSIPKQGAEFILHLQITLKDSVWFWGVAKWSLGLKSLNTAAQSAPGAGRSLFQGSPRTFLGCLSAWLLMTPRSVVTPWCWDGGWTGSTAGGWHRGEVGQESSHTNRPTGWKSTGLGRHTQARGNWVPSQTSQPTKMHPQTNPFETFLSLSHRAFPAALGAVS